VGVRTGGKNKLILFHDILGHHGRCF
jgi:hypothetical protein